MARPKNSDRPQITAGQASYVLDRLISDRRVKRSEIAKYISEMQNEIGMLEQRLHSLREAAGHVVDNVVALVRPRRGRPPAAAKAAVAAGTAGAGRKRRRAAITAEQKASRVLQGRYLGLIRQIPASRRGQYQRIAKEKGREAAIKEMLSSLGK